MARHQEHYYPDYFLREYITGDVKHFCNDIIGKWIVHESTASHGFLMNPSDEQETLDNRSRHGNIASAPLRNAACTGTVDNKRVKKQGHEEEEKEKKEVSARCPIKRKVFCS